MTRPSRFQNDIPLDYRLAARVPFGIIISEMLAIESKAIPNQPSHPIARAIDIQKELIVIDLIRRDVEAGGPYREVIQPEAIGNLVTLNPWHLIAPVGAALESFRSRFLLKPSLDLSDLWERAGQLQLMNQVPASVPPIGHIYTSALAALGRQGGALITHAALNATLLIQAVCRSLLEPSERGRMSICKIYETDPTPLRVAQEIANRLFVQKRSATAEEITELRELLQIAVGWLLECGFTSYAHTVIAFLSEPQSPLSLRS